jgi:outer membrane biosynthesis protein TonB
MASPVNYSQMRKECAHLNTKRLVLIIVGAVITGKLFAMAIVRFAENSNVTSSNLGRHLFLEKETDDQLRLNDVPENLKITRKRKTIPAFTIRPPLPVQPLVAKPIAKTAEEAKEEKKEQERRKKRKKKLEEKTNEVAKKAQQQPLPPVADQFVAPPTSSTYLGFPLPNPSPAANTTTTTAATPTTAARPGNGINITNWIRLMTTNPSAQLMTNFENLYKNRQITEAQYYQVLDAMQISANTESRNYSVQGSNVYQNINSFKILADESQTETDPNVKQEATTYVDVYSAPADKPILQVALQSGDQYEKIVAMQLLGQLANVMVQNRGSSSMAHSMFDDVTGFVEALTRDPSAEVQGTAYTTLEAIRKASLPSGRT